MSLAAMGAGISAAHSQSTTDDGENRKEESLQSTNLRHKQFTFKRVPSFCGILSELRHITVAANSVCCSIRRSPESASVFIGIMPENFIEILKSDDLYCYGFSVTTFIKDE